MNEISFVWPLSGSGDVLNGKIVSDKMTILRSKNDQNHAFKWVKQALKGMIFPKFRLSVLNSDETVKYVLPEDKITSGGSYSENYQNGQRRSLSFSLINTDGAYTPSVFNLWDGTKILFEAGAYSPDQEMTFYVNSGVFVVKSLSVSRESTGSMVSVECEDKYSIFEGSKGLLPDGVEIKYGIDIKDIIDDILTYQSGDGTPLDPKPCIYHSSFVGKKTPNTLTLSSGAHWSDLLSDLAEILSAEVFYNANGNLVFMPIVEVTHDGDKPLIKEYVDYSGEIVQNSCSIDFSQVVNYIKVFGGTVNGHVCVATAENNDPNSPICTSRIGYHYGSPINDDAISSDVIAQERADYELRLNTIFTTSFPISVDYDPTLTVNNLIAYSDSFFGMTKERFLIEGISYSLDYETKLSLTLSNINNLPFLTRTN